MSKNYYNIEKMEGYYRIGSPENVFSYVIVGDKQAALIDTGYGFGDLKEAVRSITSLPLYIFNTHGTVITLEETVFFMRIFLSTQRTWIFAASTMNPKCAEKMLFGQKTA